MGVSQQPLIWTKLSGEALLEVAAEDLAGMVVGQAAGIQNPDAARRLVGGKVLPTPIQQITFACREAFVQFNRGGGSLALFLVRQAQGGRAGDSGVGHYSLFKFTNIDRVTARLDHILYATHEPDHAEAIACGQIARSQPTVGGDQILVIDFVFPVDRRSRLLAKTLPLR